MWLGTRGTVSRLRVTDTGWMGIWTGANANDAVLSDLTIDNIYTGDPPAQTLGPGNGIYVEHWTRRTTFERFQIGPTAGAPWEAGHYMPIGIVTERANPGYGSSPVPGETLDGSQSNTFRDGVINSAYVGFSFEDAEHNTVSNVTFKNQSAAAIKDFRTDGATSSLQLRKSQQ